MVEEVVKQWLDELKENFNATELNEIPMNVIYEEIDGIKTNIEFCKTSEDSFGLACNQCYLKYLEELLPVDDTSREITINICNNKYTITDGKTSEEGFFEDKPKDQDAQIMIAMANFLGYEAANLLNFDDDTFDLD